MKKNNLILINFSRRGGIHTFANILNNQLKPFLFINTNNIFMLVYYILKYNTKKIVFCNNNYKIYLLRILLKKPILIMHDHKLRICPKLLERVTFYLFILNSKMFDKIIIHNNDNKFLKKHKNSIFVEMPFHSQTESLLSSSKIKILFYGRIEFYKNLHHLITVFEDSFINSNFELYIFGAGKLSSNLLQRIENLNSIFLLNTFIPSFLVDYAFSISHFLILPYNSLTQTDLIKLAAHNSTPCIVSNIDDFNIYKKLDFVQTIDISSVASSIKSLKGIYLKFEDNYDLMVKSTKSYNNRNNIVSERYTRYLYE